MATTASTAPATSQPASQGAPGPTFGQLPGIVNGKPARSKIAETPVIPVMMIMIGSYLAWFGVHYWRDQTTLWPSDPVKDILQGKGLPAPDPSASVITEIESSTAKSQDTESGSGADEINVTTPGSGKPAQNINLGKLMAGGYGWTGSEFTDLVQLWTQESGWRAAARNSSSGAFGIAQALGHGTADTAAADGTNEYGPDNGVSVATAKAANAGSATAQIAWGLAYIHATYGSPSAAWAHEQAYGWY